MQSTPYRKVTEDVRISVFPEHFENASDVNAGVFAFTYTVLIENLRNDSVQLLERHWLIHSGDRRFAEVVGPGVVGENPVLNPKESFKYQSNAVIEHPVGTMQGSYTFRSESGRFFLAEIPKFDLLYPMVVH